MAENTTKYWNDDKNFPIIYENRSIRIYKTAGDDILVEDIESNITMRIGIQQYPGSGLQFTTDELIDPFGRNNKIFWAIKKRKL